MTRAEEASIAYQLVAHGPRVMGGDAVLSDDDFKFWNINYDFVAGYKQAEKDLALTWEDIKKIDSLSMEVTTLFVSVGRNKDILERPFYEEVARRFNEQRKK